MKMIRLLIACSIAVTPLAGLEIAKEELRPGVVLVFEGMTPRHALPYALGLEQNTAQVYLSVCANWAEVNTPKGTVAGSFVPYLAITAEITNRSTGHKTTITLLPHMDIRNSLHYARNTALPGALEDSYDVVFTVTPPASPALSLDKDWADAYGRSLVGGQIFRYENVAFARSSR